MTSLVILDPSLAAQVRENPQGLEGLDVRWVGDDPHAFLQAIRRCNPDVLVVNLELLPGDGAQAWLQRALDESSAGLLLCLYRFAPRSVLGSVPPERAHGEGPGEPVALEGAAHEPHRERPAPRLG